jgi:hypothetical protein
VTSEPTCDEDALFSRDDATGSMFFINCYQTWAVEMDELNDNGNPIYAASLDIDEDFHTEGMRVKFDACFYDFDLPLIIPDPSFFGEMYVIRDYEIEEEN